MRHVLALPDLALERVVAGVWLVDEGAIVTAGDRLLEVLADGVSVELPAPADGVLIAQLVDEDEPLSVGQALAVIQGEPAADDP